MSIEEPTVGLDNRNVAIRHHSFVVSVVEPSELLTNAYQVHFVISLSTKEIVRVKINCKINISN